MEKKYYLMLKQHKKTGLKYLCFHCGTVESCHRYKGSGLYWKNHLRVHGRNISTIILKESDDRGVISSEGLRYSELWDIVESEEFANLIVENAESVVAPLHTEEARQKGRDSNRKRIEKYGLTDKEKEAKKRIVAILHNPENRKKARESIDNRYKTGNLTERQRQSGPKRRRRIQEDGFTEKEQAYHAKVAGRQQGKSMRERLNDPDWVNPLRGKTGIEIQGDGYVHPRQGKRLKDTKGVDYVEPKSKPFKLIVNGIETLYFTAESDFMERTKFTSPMLCKFKRNGSHVVKRQSNSLHDFKTGDIMEYYPLTIEQYKMETGEK